MNEAPLYTVTVQYVYQNREYVTRRYHDVPFDMRVGRFVRALARKERDFELVRVNIPWHPVNLMTLDENEMVFEWYDHNTPHGTQEYVLECHFTVR